MSESIGDRIQKDLLTAMKAKDEESVRTLRMLKAAILEVRTRKSKDEPFGADEELAVLKRYVRQCREAMAEMEKAGDTARKAQEAREITITERYLPAQMPTAELEAVVAETIAASGAAGPKDAGRVIGAVMGRVKGRADGGEVARLVREKLGTS